MNENKKIYYDIYSEFYSVNKFRELKTIVHHGDNRLNHINRVAKMSFFISKRLGLDYISCTRGALMHDFFTTDDVSKNDYRYKQFLNKHPVEALNNSLKYFDVNDMEEDIILSHMYFKININIKKTMFLCTVTAYAYGTNSNHLISKETWLLFTLLLI